MFGEHAYALRTVRFWIAVYGSVVKTFMMKFALEDLLWTISMLKFWLY
jgi:hypothetical protein